MKSIEILEGTYKLVESCQDSTKGPLFDLYDQLAAHDSLCLVLPHEDKSCAIYAKGLTWKFYMMYLAPKARSFSIGGRRFTLAWPHTYLGIFFRTNGIGFHPTDHYAIVSDQKIANRHARIGPLPMPHVEDSVGRICNGNLIHDYPNHHSMDVAWDEVDYCEWYVRAFTNTPFKFDNHNYPFRQWIPGAIYSDDPCIIFNKWQEFSLTHTPEECAALPWHQTSALGDYLYDRGIQMQ